MKILRRHPWEIAGLLVFTIIALAMTMIVGNTLARSTSGNTDSYSALFTDASGIRVGDDVRIAGVKVGRVEGRELTDDGLAKVDFVLSSDQEVRTDTVARISYLNLLGQRYLALEAGPEAGTALPRNAVIDTDHTRPALDLTELFNAFKPMFEALDPGDINLIANELVQTLQGQGPQFAHTLQQTAELTEHLAGRDEIITRVIANVTTVMEATSMHREELQNVISGLDGLVGDLADDSGDIDSAVQAMDRMTAAMDGLLDESSDSLSVAIARFAELGDTLVANNDVLATTLEDAPDLLDGFNRALSHGSWLNTYVCTLDVGVGGIKIPDILGVSGNSEPCR
ncbi:MAG TPA: MlaD family protein [Aeromicrobium sp.]|nr:MlaD family protein [Aeromicrobium sp.]